MMSEPNATADRLFHPDLARETEEAVKDFLENDWDHYMTLVKRLASHPENRSGADKSWVEKLLEMNERHYRNAVRVR